VEPVQLKTLCQWAEGKLICGDPEILVTRLCTDSRTLQAGDLFVPLRGENFDGHAYIEQAKKVRAAGALSEYEAPEDSSGFAIIQVKNTLKALQMIASRYRQTLPLKTIAITGSNGKTSTKDFTAAVLSERFEVIKTEGNFNNHIGLPLTILRADKRHQVGVFEIGMNHPGEIAPLAEIAAPDLGIITNVGTAHIEFMVTRDAIALEKGALAEAIPQSGTLILSADDDYCDAIAGRTGAKIVLTGIGKGEIQASEIRAEADGTRFIITSGEEKAEAVLAVPGEHMVRNALLAVAAGKALGMSLKECCTGLAKARLTKGRLELKTVRGIQFLDDSYNANPDSVIAALRTLAQIPAKGRRFALLGKMNELGAEAENGHRRVGAAAAAERIDYIVSVGDGFSGLIAESARQAGAKEVFQTDSTEEAIDLLGKIAVEGDLVLVKGSRSVRMERIVEGFAAL
jgi:UDP-N-acetylmuramoyl-tripeptide--D-alanyl-D-alanine ligase